MTLPTALVIGPMKAGTTWIHEYLAARGDVCLPAGVKEVFFFDRSFAKGQGWYAEHFSHNDPTRHLAIIEVAPSLFHNQEAPKRVRDALGTVSILFTLRDPVQRTWSHYLHLRRYGYTRASLREAAKNFPQLLEASRYQSCRERWRDALPLAQFTTLHMENLKENKADYVAELCKGLGLPYRDPDVLKIAPANVAAEAPSFWRAQFGRKVSYGLRDAGLYSVVNAAKNFGMKRIFFGSPQINPVKITASPDDIAWIKDQLGLSE